MSVIDATIKYSDNDYFLDFMIHRKERRRQRIKGWYICYMCNNQYIRNRPNKEFTCPVCNHALQLVSTVDEFEINRIREYSEDNIIIENDEFYSQKINAAKHFFQTRKE